MFPVFLADMFQLMGYSAPAIGVIGLIYAFILSQGINKRSDGDETMKKIAAQIQKGARAFLVTEYKYLAIYVVIVAIILGVFHKEGGHHWIAIAFVTGALAVLGLVGGSATAGICLTLGGIADGTAVAAPTRKAASDAFDERDFYYTVAAIGGGVGLGVGALGAALVAVDFLVLGE